MSQQNGKKAQKDSFSDLMSFAGGSSAKNNKAASMTMQERQAALLKEQQQKKETQKNAWGASLDQLGSLGGSPGSITPTLSKPSTPMLGVDSASTTNDDDDDPFDVFNKPPPPKAAPVAPTPPPSRAAPKVSRASEPSNTLLEGFTDAFPSRPAPSQSPSPTVSTSTRASTPASESHRSSRESPKSLDSDKRDHSIAELVDMGFSVDQAKRGLANSDTGLDVRQAIDFLMKEAHRKATGQGDEPSRPSSAGSSTSGRSRDQQADIAKVAHDLSNQFISKGMSFFNQGRKNIAKAIEQYTVNSPNDGTPAWMRNQEKYIQRESRQRKSNWDDDAEEVDLSKVGGPKEKPNFMTDEALALESRTREDVIKPRARASVERSEHSSRASARRVDQAPKRSSFQDSFKDEVEVEVSSSSNSSRSSSTAPRQEHARVQPKPTPIRTPMTSRAQEFKSKTFDEDMPTSSRRRPPPKPKAPVRPRSPARPKVAPRAHVAISTMELDMSSIARASGTDAFKRGDFTEATAFYTQALGSIPSQHLLRTIVLSNRSTCHMKLGDAKSALVDAEEGLVIIGPSLGNNEEAEPGKSLKEIWSKLVTRKAEALESRDRFKDSLDAWNLLIENGSSSSVTLDGKRRCQKALDPKPVSTPKISKPSTPIRVSTPSIAAEEALKKMRAANQNAEKEETEKFKLVDGVEAKINAWRGGKEDNLRGLISTVDVLLWPELNWKKVSLADLVLPKRVKINYMKAVAKTHPDKVPANATTEQKMIAQAVFVTINKAWDDFKAANGLN